MNRLVWIITLPLAFLVVLFALMNRQEVVLSLWPLPWEIGLPLFLLTLGALVAGFLLGALSAYFSGGATRRKLRHTNRALAEARADLKQQIPAGTHQQLVQRPPAALPPVA